MDGEITLVSVMNLFSPKVCTEHGEASQVTYVRYMLIWHLILLFCVVCFRVIWLILFCQSIKFGHYGSQTKVFLLFDMLWLKGGIVVCWIFFRIIFLNFLYIFRGRTQFLTKKRKLDRNNLPTIFLLPFFSNQLAPTGWQHAILEDARPSEINVAEHQEPRVN